METGSTRYSTVTNRFSTESGFQVLSKIQSGESLFLLLMFTAAILIRILVMSSQPAYAGTADAGTWAALAREIRDNGFIIPATNAIHYPGSRWVYPPVIPYLLALVSLFTGVNGMGLFYSVAALEIFLQSITVIPVYLAVRRLFGVQPAVISSAMFIAFPPMLYLITWSALPQITAFLVLSLVILEFSRIQMEGISSRKEYVIISFLSFSIVFIHDVSAFLYAAMLIGSIIFYAISDRLNRSDRYRLLTKASLIGFVSTLAGMLIWYLPRLQWISETGSISTTGSLTSISGFLYTDLLNLAQPLAAPHYVYGLSLVLIPLSLLFIILHFSRFSRGKISAVLLFSLVTMILFLLSAPFPLFFIRISYFLTFLYLYFAAYVVYRFMYPRIPDGDSVPNEKMKKAAKAFGIFFVAFLVLYSAWGVTFEYSAHSYYLSNGKQSPDDIISAAEWISGNINQSSVIAASGYTGYFIMGYSGNPVLTSINSTELTQFIELNESRDAGILVNSPLLNLTQTVNIIQEYGISLVVTDLSSTQVPNFYDQLYSSGGIFIYRV